MGLLLWIGLEGYSSTHYTFMTRIYHGKYEHTCCRVVTRAKQTLLGCIVAVVTKSHSSTCQSHSNASRVARPFMIIPYLNASRVARPFIPYLNASRVARPFIPYLHQLYTRLYTLFDVCGLSHDNCASSLL